MKTCIRLLSCLCVLPICYTAHAANFTNVFQPGYSTFSNPFDNVSSATFTNNVWEIIPRPVPGLSVSKWVGPFFGIGPGAPFPNNWDPDLSWDDPSMLINPGEGAVLYIPGSTPFTNIFKGTPHVPVLPITLTPGQFYFLSDQTLEVGSYESIVGTAPVEGSTVYLYTNQVALTNFNAWDVHRFTDGSWHPSAPVIPAGGAAMFRIDTNQVAAAATPPTISQIALVGEQIHFSFNAESNRTYAVEFRALTNGSSWAVLTNIPSQQTPNAIQITDSVGVESTIYRVRTP
jgi:hypothetical protein